MMDIMNLLVKEYPLKCFIEYPLYIYFSEFQSKYPRSYHIEFIRYIPCIYLMDYPLAYKIPYRNLSYIYTL